LKRIALTICALAAALGLTAGGLALADSHTPARQDSHRHAATYKAPAIHHVWIIVLENESESVSFGPDSPAPYLAKTLVKEGVFLKNYYATGHASNDNYISMISGQPPNFSNQTDCGSFKDFTPDLGTGPHGAQIGEGCVYPANIQNIATQLDVHKDTWRDYNQDMVTDPTRGESSVCSHPAVGTTDMTEADTPTSHYATRHNPFVYFHAIIDHQSLCDSHVVNLNDLPGDLKSASKTPDYSFITPDLCGDGHDATGSDCIAPGDPGGFAGISKFLETWVPKITHSPAFTKQHGLLFITFDEASESDTSKCCGEIPGSSFDGLGPGISGPGGGLVGAIAISPCIKPGTVSSVDYNHYTMLGSMENLFHLPHIGYAQLPKETYFGKDVFTNPSCKSPAKKKT
jgi:phosphatidylinositol-3-phosphatase